MKLVATRPRDDRLIQRDDELRTISCAVESAAAGNGGVVVIESADGLGKSALLDYARECGRDVGMRVLAGNASEFESSMAFGTAAMLFLDHLASRTHDEPSQLLSGRAAPCRALFGYSDHTVEAWEADRDTAVIEGLYWLTVNVATASPALLLLDDIHCADEQSLRFLIYLIRRLRTLPVAVIITLRNGAIDSTNALMSSILTAAGERHLRLQPLTQAGVLDYLHVNAPDLLSAKGFASFCADVSGGNPFLIGELVDHVRIDIEIDPNTVATDLAEAVPAAVLRRIMLRLSYLGANEVALARACAVLGQRATLSLAAPLAALSVEDAAYAADRLIRSGVLHEGTSLRFSQPMLQAAIYHDLPAGSRALAHATAARLLRSAGDCSGDIAHHLMLGAPVAEAWAADALRSGADEAARNGSPGTAAEYLRRAIAADTSGFERSAIMRDLGLLEAAAGETEAALTRLQSAAQSISEPAEQARCLYALGQTLYRDGQHTQAARAFERCASLSQHTDDDLALSAAGAWVFTAYYLDAVPSSALMRLSELCEQVRSHGAVSAADKTVLAVAALHSSMTTPPAAHGAQIALEALEDDVLLGNNASECVAGTWVILALIYGGQLDDAAAVVTTMIEDAHKRGNAPAAAEAALMSSFVHLARGEVHNAYLDAHSAMEGVTSGWHGLAPIAVGTLAQCLIERGELDEAEHVLCHADGDIDGEQARGLKSWIYMSRGRLQYSRGEMQAALDDFLAAGRALSAFGTVNPAVLRWRSMAGLAAHALGDTQLASDLIDQELHLADAFGLPQDIGAALRAKALTASGPRRESLLRESLSVLECAGNALDLAETLFCLGAEIRRRGQRTQAREPLSRAMDVAHRCGARALETLVREELLATGAKPRRPTMTGVESLTPTERRVAALAAEGLTNPEIAIRLYLAKSTIAWHLRHVFLKLGIESRGDLVHVLQTDVAEPAQLLTVG